MHAIQTVRQVLIHIVSCDRPRPKSRTRRVPIRWESGGEERIAVQRRTRAASGAA